MSLPILVVALGSMVQGKYFDSMGDTHSILLELRYFLSGNSAKPRRVAARS